MGGGGRPVEVIPPPPSTAAVPLAVLPEMVLFSITSEPFDDEVDPAAGLAGELPKRAVARQYPP